MKLAAAFAVGFMLACLPVTDAVAQQTPEHYSRLYAANFSGHVSVIDTATDELIDLIEVGGMVDDVVGSPDGRYVYANVWITENHRYLPNFGELVAIDTATHDIAWRLPIRDGWPHHISISPDGRFIYSPVFDRTYINVIDVERRTVARKFDGVLGMHGTKLTKDGKRLYVGAMTMESLIVLDTDTGEITKSIDFDGGVRPFDFTEDEKTLYTQLSRTHGFAVADLEKGVPTETVFLPRRFPDRALPSSWPHTVNHGLEITPDETMLVAAGSVDDFVALYSLPDLHLNAVVPICAGPNWVSITEDSLKAYVSCQDSGEVSVIDLPSKREIKRIAAGGKQTVRMRLVNVPVK